MSVVDGVRRGTVPASRKAVLAAVLAHPEAREAEASLARSTGRSEWEVHTELLGCLDELVVVERKLAATALRPLLWLLSARPWTIRAGHTGAWERTGTAPVFVVAHRSYVDALVLNRVLERQRCPRSYIVTGANLRFWPVGPLGRRSHLVFLRRQFTDDPGYKLALRLYLAFLLRQGRSLQFAIEGGRSRDGALRPPRLGLLRYLMDAVDEGVVPELDLVPVAVTYDHLYEANALVDEQAGASKQAEGPFGLLRLAWAHRRRRGVVDVRFGEPLRLRRAAGHGEPSDADVVATANQLCTRINRATPITPIALTTLVLLGSPEPRWTVARLHAQLTALVEFVRLRGFPLAVPVERLTPETVREWVAHLVAVGVLEDANEAEADYLLPSSRRRLAAYYRNSSWHWFLPRAIAEIALLRAVSAAPEEREALVRKEVASLATLCGHAVTGLSTTDLGALAAEEAEFVVAGWREIGAAELSRRLHAVPCPLAPLVLRHLVDGFSIAADQLAEQAPAEPVEEEALLQECLRAGRQRHAVLPEAVSLPLFTGAVAFLRTSGLCTSGTDPVLLRRQRRAAGLALTALRGELGDLAGEGAAR